MGMNNIKKCSKCNKKLPLNKFYKTKFKSGNIGYKSECKDCHNIRAINWQKSHKKYIGIKKHIYYQNNQDKVRKRNVEWKQNNPEYRANYRRRRKISNPELKVTDGIRRAINIALKNNTKAGNTTELLGCSIEYLHTYIESLFQPGMTWENHGRYGWHIDHIIPLSYFNLADHIQQKHAWHYTNLQPLWAADNLKKSNKIKECQLKLL